MYFLIAWRDEPLRSLSWDKISQIPNKPRWQCFGRGKPKKQRENATMGIEVGKSGGKVRWEGGGYTVLMALVIMSL